MNGADRVALKNAVAATFEQAASSAVALSHKISGYAELAFEEHHTSAALCSFLESVGYAVERGVADLSTAFSASVGSGNLVVALCAEMDALPGIGHGCGHNAIAAAAAGAAAALAPHADELGLTVRVLGTPAEEKGTGKEIMIRHGVFDDVHAGMMVHPSLKDAVRPQFRASRTWTVTYTGRGGHASRPWDALNAADATVVAQTALGLLRQQLRDGLLVHTLVRDSGSAVNVIADRAVVECMVRANTIAEVDETWGRVRRCFEAGALASGTSAKIELEPSLYREFNHHDELAGMFQTNAESVGRTFPEQDNLFGSTDMGNVSQVAPAIHPMLSFELPAGSATHTADFAVAAAGPQGDRFVRDGGLAMALTLADAATTGLRDRLLEGRSRS